MVDGVDPCGSERESCAPGGGASKGATVRTVFRLPFTERALGRFECALPPGRTSFFPTGRRVPSRPFIAWIFATETWCARAIFPSVSPFRTTCVAAESGAEGIAPSTKTASRSVRTRFISGIVLHMVFWKFPEVYHGAPLGE